MFDKARTLLALGLPNLARVGAYRLGLRLGLHPVQKLKADPPLGPFFRNNSSARTNAVASGAWRDNAVLFSAHYFPITGIPDWNANPFRPGVRADEKRNWWEISHFDPAIGDIKTVWETSRFEWLVAMAQRASLGDIQELDRLNSWLDDWARANPPYRGVNWGCGQEASIRVMHLVLAALILNETNSPSDSLRSLVRLHLARIAPTMGYAIGQQNNHGTSESAALFIGGSWLAALGEQVGEGWARAGRYWLEERARTLIEPDGTFSQYSVVYHRMMLDTYSLVEVWRRHKSLPEFSPLTTNRLQAATRWLQQMTEPRAGDAPNLGANDGARIMPLSGTSFRDFRPSLQLAASLFSGSRAIAERGAWDQPGVWLDVPEPVGVMPAPASVSFDNGGVHVMRQGEATAYLRYPRFRFRPSQADALHLDLWSGDQNILRDAGSYSYGETLDEAAQFSGTGMHNTVEFDGRDQMPRLGRFLFGSWLKTRNPRLVHADGCGVAAAAGYRDRWGAGHDREVKLAEHNLVCVDELGGRAKTATLRWRLMPGTWRLEGQQVSNGSVVVEISSDKPVVRISLNAGYESRHYLEKTPIQVLEVETAVPARLTTRVSF